MAVRRQGDSVTAHYMGFQTKRCLPIGCLISQQNRRPGEGHPIEFPYRCTHIFYVRIGQFVGHSHAAGREVVQFCFDLREITRIQISTYQ